MSMKQLRKVFKAQVSGDKGLECKPDSDVWRVVAVTVAVLHSRIYSTAM